MSTFYVVPSASGASDSNDGTTATTGGGHGPWSTMGHAASTMTSGDTTRVQGGHTFRETITIASNNQTWVADLDGSLTGFSGDTILTAYTTNDTTAPSGTVLINGNSKTGISFTGFRFIGGTASPGIYNAGASAVTGISFTRCEFIYLGATNAITMTEAGAGAGPTFDRCSAIGDNAAVSFMVLTLTRSASADFDCGMKVTNCAFLKLSATGALIQITAGGASTFFGGGGLFAWNTILSGGNILDISNAAISGIFPTKVLGNYVMAGGNTTLSGGNRGGIVEDWNIFDTPTGTRSNVGIGPNTIGVRTYAPLWELWSSFATDRYQRPFMTPGASAPQLGFVPAGQVIDVSAAATAADDNTVGTVTWTNPSNALSPDGTNFATNAIGTSATGHYLKITNCNFSLPSDATVTQIRVEYWASQTGTGQAVGNSIKTVNSSGTIGGNDNSAQITNLTTTMTLYSVGSAGDLWGRSWLYSDINNSAFGVVISFKNSSGTNTITANVDYVRIIVSYTRSSANVPTEQQQDFISRPRPAGGNSANLAAGAFERHDTFTRVTSPVHAGTYALQCTGPGDHDFAVALDAGSNQVISVYAQYDGSYGSGTLPQLVVKANAEMGLSSDTTTTMSAVGSGTWSQLTATVSPTSAGWVMCRYVSSAAANGNAYFDDAD